MEKNNCYREKGAALYLVIIVISILGGIAFGASSLIIGRIVLLSGVEHSGVAFYAAEAGLEAVSYADSQGLDITECDGTGSAPAFCAQTFPNGAGYEVVIDTVSCPGMAYCLESVGTFQKSVRKIRIER